MILKNKGYWNAAVTEGFVRLSRLYSSNSKIDFKKLKPMILKRINDRSKDYPVKAMIPLAREVLEARALLIQGVSILMQVIPVWACKFCPEVHVGPQGHSIKTCWGCRHRAKNQVHEWIPSKLNDIIVPVETYHLQNMSQDIIRHDQRFDFDRIPAIAELCWQAGVSLDDETLKGKDVEIIDTSADSLSKSKVWEIANGTLNAWEVLRTGVQKLLMVYPARVCSHCSEVHVGPSGHKARMCGVFAYESWRGPHFWKRAVVDDLVPPKISWSRRDHDPPVLLDERRDFYGHAPVVVDICSKAGIHLPKKYFCMMKVRGVSVPFQS
ncbi:APO protein 4, mitochondrial [Impatiens glandulifera]|uniref:APO protein 4, mitochondrial n=1 Tax=Impatiens glandulifera TaxID=253017 RepID=UPI001FB06644|nr:APO protein 4, mitochondrial [Impatiens glandulifera]